MQSQVAKNGPLPRLVVLQARRSWLAILSMSVLMLASLPGIQHQAIYDGFIACLLVLLLFLLRLLLTGLSTWELQTGLLRLTVEYNFSQMINSMLLMQRLAVSNGSTN